MRDSSKSTDRDHLTTLPVELILIIAKHITSERVINALSRTNRQLNDILTPFLYDHNAKRPRGKRSALLWASEHGRETTARKALEARKSLTAKKPLLVAGQKGHHGIVKLLLEKDGVDLEYKRSRLEYTPLAHALTNGHDAVVKLLLDAGANIDPWPRGRKRMGLCPSLLSIAAKEGRCELIKLLLATGKLHVDDGGYRRESPLVTAVRGGHESAVKLLVEAGANPKVSLPLFFSYYPTTLLQIAIGQGYNNIVKVLLAAGGFDVNSDADTLRPLLVTAAEKGNSELVRLLLTTDNVDLNVKDHRGTALCYAALEGHVEITKLLLDAGADPNVGRQAPLFLAIKHRNTEIACLIIKTGRVDPSIMENSLTTLGMAMNFPLLKLLLGSEAEPNAHGYSDNTPPSPVPSTSRFKVVQLLLSVVKAHIDPWNDLGAAYLYLGAWRGHPAMAEQLLAATKLTVNCSHLSDITFAIMEALWQSHWKTASLPIPADGINPNVTDLSRRKALPRAICENAYLDIFKRLLAMGHFNVNSQDSHGHTPLIHAAKSGFTALVKLLLSAKRIDPNLKDKRQRSPLIYAALSNSSEIVKLLLAIDNIELDARDNRGLSALDYAVSAGRNKAFRVLLMASKIDLQKDSWGMTILDRALKG
ncbi:hypothetical protein AJ79_00825 [Helicocarpus griseus UAMH5409]|uniref:Uncharacterized protein n=1 Tax=Helicocarpus griseus UAMH5409 TaxID=1447875 RepID=A0A2B7Y8U0_9EURO|nr:hypothetical protein AJ79_00825 [Helicocarpus griseus UAMH5409]